MNHIRNVIKAVKQAWLESQLQRLNDRQAVVNQRLLAAEMEAKETLELHSKATTALAHKRTQIRSRLIRL